MGSWFPDQESNLYPLHWKAEPLDYQGIPLKKKKGFEGGKEVRFKQSDEWKHKISESRCVGTVGIEGTPTPNVGSGTKNIPIDPLHLVPSLHGK